MRTITERFSHGYHMSDVILVLGPVAFQDFEIPSAINFGGRQRLAVHQLTNGRRVVDTMGPDASEIGFSGVFSGPDATLYQPS